MDWVASDVNTICLSPAISLSKVSLRQVGFSRQAAYQYAVSVRERNSPFQIFLSISALLSMRVLM
jgi:hypothetical protein